MVLHAKVLNGRFVVEEPADLPEGTQVQLALVDDGDEMDEGERAELIVDRSRHRADEAR